MTAREMHPDDVAHPYVMAAMKAAGLLHHDTARAALAAVLPMHRAEVLREAAAWGRELSRQGYSAQEIATRLDRLADAAAPTSKEQ